MTLWLTTADADAYFATRLGASAYWASGTDKEAALATAQRQLIRSNLYTFPDTPIEAQKEAVCEQALFVLQQGEGLDKRTGLIAQGVTNAGMVKESFNALIAHTAGGRIPIAFNAHGALAAAGLVKDDSVAGTGSFEVVR